MEKLKKFWGILVISLGFPLMGFADGTEPETDSETSEPWTLNMPEVVEDEAGNPIGLKLHLPEGIMNACKDKYWELKEVETLKHVQSCMSSENGCKQWCEENHTGTNYQHAKRCEFAYALFLANQKGYILDWDFCKKSNLDRILACINMRGAIRCLCYQETKEEEYIRSLENIIEYGF